MKKSQNGITLLALVITIIVLLILASISINMITGDNSILQNAIHAREQAEINDEKEQIEIASTQAMSKDKYGDLRKESLIAQLDKIRGKLPTAVTGDDELYVECTGSGRMFSISPDGTVGYIGDIETAKSIVKIKANRESNTTPQLVQEVTLTISTIMEYANDELTIHYGWTTDETAEPEQYESATVTETGKLRNRTANVSTSRFGTENNYYLWLKVKVLETGKETTKKFGPYAVKENTTLVASEYNPTATSKFLGGNLQRNQIKKITFVDSLQGHTPTADKVCWDVSTNKKGKILAWYEPIGDTGYYAVTIGQNGGVVANKSCASLFASIGYESTSGEWTPTLIEGLSNLDTSNVTSMSYMFSNINTLQNLDLQNFQTSKVTNSMGYMFNGCTNLTSLDLTSFDTHGVTSMGSMFGNCSKIAEIKWDTNKFVTDNVTDLSSMFWYCYNLRTVDVSNWNTIKNRSLQGTFQSCNSLTELNVSGWNTSNVDMNNGMLGTFNGCSSLVNLDVSNWTPKKTNSIRSMFEGCSNLKSLDVSDWDTSNIQYMFLMFSGCTNLTTLDLSRWETPKLKEAYSMFRDCNSLTSLNLSKFNTTNVKDMSNMFNGCKSLTNLNISSFNTANVTTMESMFLGCSSLPILDLTNFDTSQVKNMDNMFRNCTFLTEIDISSFSVSNVTSMSFMFSDCSNLTELYASNFGNSPVTKINRMFQNCSNLNLIDLSNFKTDNLTSVYCTFYGCSSLTTIKLLKLNLENVTSKDRMLTSVKPNVEIITNASTKTWLNANFPSYTNIVVPAT